MSEITKKQTIAERARSKQEREEAYLKLTEVEAFGIVEEAALMIEAFFLNYHKLNITSDYLEGIVKRYKDADDILEGMLTLNKYNRKN